LIFLPRSVWSDNPVHVVATLWHLQTREFRRPGLSRGSSSDLDRACLGTYQANLIALPPDDGAIPSHDLQPVILGLSPIALRLKHQPAFAF
jgi:hypothetical protein